MQQEMLHPGVIIFAYGNDPNLCHFKNEWFQCKQTAALTEKCGKAGKRGVPQNSALLEGQGCNVEAPASFFQKVYSK